MSTTASTVTFIRDTVPKLDPGTYTVGLTQHIEDTAQSGATSAFDSTINLIVRGERFAIAPKEINSVFPSPGQGAHVESPGVLPQVVFNRQTLPWERSAYRFPTGDQRYTTWLAVLLLTADDVAGTPAGQPPLKIESKQVKDLTALPAHYLSYPNLKLEMGETSSDGCRVIDLPIDLFNKTAPSVSGLAYLAHCRQLSSEGKSETVSVVLGNRMATLTNTRHHYAYLVSLEHMAKYLPREDGAQSQYIRSGTTHIRLVVLKDWSFRVSGTAQSLIHLLENVQQTGIDPKRKTRIYSTGLRLPAYNSSAAAQPTKSDVSRALSRQKSGSPQGNDGAILVNHALNMGYLPLNHKLRHGGNTVSWYRGPLAPFAAEMPPVTSASYGDKVNRYNPYTGLFDVSYGAAWQLGRLLTLEHKAVALAMYRDKHRMTQMQRVAAERERLPDDVRSTFEISAPAQATQPTLSPNVRQFLSELYLLKHVPFNYLVPHEAMLPPESLRFFHLDESWTQVLIDGAYSIGRSTWVEIRRDAQHAAKIFEMAKEQTLTAAPSPPAPPYDGPVTGFLLRSQAVQSWRNLEINGYAKTADIENLAAIPLPVLSRRQIGTDVLFCMFKGDVKLVTMHQPAHTLHCGALPAGTNTFNATLRTLGSSNPGQQLVDSDYKALTVPVSLRTDKQTLNVVKTAATIKNTLETYQQAPSAFTSAEFAVEMVQGVEEVGFFNPPSIESKQWKDFKGRVDYTTAIHNRQSNEHKHQTQVGG